MTQADQTAKEALEPSVMFSATSHEGLSVTTADGKPAQLAVLDGSGGVITAGQEVAAAVYEVSIRSYREFLIGKGHIKTIVCVSD